MIRLLTFTSLYPNPEQPRHGIFVEQRLRRLVDTGYVSVRVVAPIAWFPISSGPFRKFRVTKLVPNNIERFGVKIRYPRFPVVPGLSGWFNPLLMALAVLPTVQRLRREQGDFDVIDAQFVYPDGIAGMLLGVWLQKPVVITARGSDVNVFGKMRVPRWWIRWAARRCKGFIAVSSALKEALIELGVEPSKVSVLRNGVDLSVFQPNPQRDQLRNKLGVTGQTLLSVGNLVEEKGHDLVIAALENLTETHLIIIGSGPMEARLRSLAARLGVSDRVRWISYLTHTDLAEFYCAADILVLASSREGMPNVLLESLACGTPVIATNVGGSPEVVADPVAGQLIHVRSGAAIADAYRNIVRNGIDRKATRHYGEQFGWEQPIAGQVRLLKLLLGQIEEKLPVAV